MSIQKFLIAEKQFNKQFLKMIRKGRMWILYPFRCTDHSLSRIAIVLSPRALNLSHTTFLQHLHKEQLSGVLLGNLKSSFCPDWFQRTVLFSKYRLGNMLSFPPQSLAPLFAELPSIFQSNIVKFTIILLVKTISQQII